MLTGGGSNLKHLRQLANYITGFDSRIGYANEYISNDKNQHLKSPEFATSIGLLMESLSIRDKKTNSLVQEEVSVSSQTVSDETNQEDKILDSDKPTHNETVVQQNASKKPTIGQNILEKIKKFFEESE